MGRRVQKVAGALVKMGRRRTPGMGIIIELTEKPPWDMSPEEKKSSGNKKPLASDHQAAYSKEICALVHWFERPSEWENIRTWSNRTWVPVSWLRIVKKEVKRDAEEN